MIEYYLNRWGRDFREFVNYPFWSINNIIGPDNHLYKRKRIKLINADSKYFNFIETGTFYGQMINAVYRNFSKILSVELFDVLFELNHKIYSKDDKVQIFHGDSALLLGKMVDIVKNDIVFWLDGHYSGSGTGIGEQTSPIIFELDIIKSKNLTNCCILIDDIRLFDGTDGYPTLEKTISKIKEIDDNCKPYVDKDCLVAIIKK